MAQLGFGLNINETAAKTGYDQYSVRLGETLGAVAADNWNFNPLSSIGTYWDMESARSQAMEAEENRVSRDELNEEYSDLGLFFKKDEFQSVVDIMVQEKKEERQRQSIIERGPKGFAVGAAKFATGLGVSLFDPINIAASFIPVFGQARFAGLVARQGFTRARLARGVTEGAVGAAVVEPIVYGVAQKVQADYGLADSLLNITFGTILGGGLHVGAGKLKDLRTASKFKKRMKEAGTPDKQLNLYKEYYPENSRVMRDLEMTNPQTRKLLLEKSLNDLLLEKPVDVSPVVSADPVLKNSTDTVATSQIRSKPVSEVDQMELNTVEQNVSNKKSPDIDIENNNLEVRLNAIKENQKTRNILLDDDVETRTTKEELDEVNTKSKDLDEIIKDTINCVNGR
jgi:hypothetical protein